MPTYRQAHYLTRAVETLLAQSMQDWELVIVDDGSPDDTASVVKPYLSDPRIQYEQFLENHGMGAALNRALAVSTAPVIAYLPSDDVWFVNHLESLLECLDSNPQAVLAYSGVRHVYRSPGAVASNDDTSTGQIEGKPLQLVQVMHRRTDAHWIERDELVTDDLERMFWNKLRAFGEFVGTEQISCQWIDQPHQRHKLIQEPIGGVNPYRYYFNVKEPLKFHSTKGFATDEVEHYRRFRERPDTPKAKDGLDIVLVGELAFNPERVLALEEQGHKLYGLWTPDCHWFNSVGPQPFGHVTDLPRIGWEEAVRKIKPDLFYGMLNWIAIPFAHHVMTSVPEIPFVWHLKEGPFDSIASGTWHQLVELHTKSAGQIYSSPEMREWFARSVPASAEGMSMVLDGDLPKAEWFTDTRTPQLAESLGGVHTVIPGQPTGITPELIAELAAQDIHIHFYGDFHRSRYADWVRKALEVADGHFHLHPQVSQENWVSELSQYDAGWLHQFESTNGGDIGSADWEDLNYPARIPTLACAGLPFIQRDNSGAIVAQQSLAQKFDVGVAYRTPQELATRLNDHDNMEKLRRNLWEIRQQFTFDAYAGDLVTFFRKILSNT